MNVFSRLVVAVSVLSVCILGGTAPAHAQFELADAVLAGGELAEQDLSVPSLAGPAGIVSMPNAITMPAGTWQAALSYQGMGASSGMDQAPDDLSAWSLQAAHRLNDTAELWASYSSAADHVGSHTWALGGKKMLTHLEGEGPFVAVGASYHRWGDAFASGSWGDGAGRPDANVTKAYAVVTHAPGNQGLGAGVLVTGGLMYIGIDPDRGRSRSLTRPFVAVQAIVWTSGRSTEVIEPSNAKGESYFEPESGLLIRNGLPCFHLKLPEEVLSEIGEAGLSVLHWELDEREEEDGPYFSGALIVVAARPC